MLCIYNCDITFPKSEHKKYTNINFKRFFMEMLAIMTHFLCYCNKNNTFRMIQHVR